MINKIYSKNCFINKYAKVIPNLLKFQEKFYNNLFKTKILSNVIKKIFPLFSKDLLIKINFRSFILKKPVINYKDCLEKKINYNFRIYLKLCINILKKKKKKLILKNSFNKKYLLCNIPILLKNFSFLINGIQRVVISQLIKSPGIYIETNKTKELIFKIIPLKGFWIEIILGKKNRISFKINKQKKNNIIILLKCLGMSVNEIFNSLSPTRYIKLYKKKIYINFDYNDYKQKKLNKDLYDIYGNMIMKKGVFYKSKIIKQTSFVLLSKKHYEKLIIAEKFSLNNISFYPNNRLNFFKIFKKTKKPIYIKIFDIFKKDLNQFLLNSFFFDNFLDYETSLKFFYCYMNPKKKYNKNTQLFYNFFNKSFYNKNFFYLSKNVRTKLNNLLNINLESNFLEKQDFTKIIFFLINYNLKKKLSDIDSLDNKIIKCSGNFLYDILEKRISFLSLNIFDRINKRKDNLFKNILNSKILSIYIQEFFCVSQFSQFLDQTNILSEITHKRRLTLLGPGGIIKGKVSNSIRNIHLSYYGKICPVETPEGKNIGLVNSFAIFSKINNEYFIESPYLKILNGKLINKYYFLDYNSEFNSHISYANFPFKNNKKIICRFRNKLFYYNLFNLDYVDISHIQGFSLASLMIPFMEHNDANRALMGSNMQRQSLTGLKKNIPYISTGIEIIPALDLCYLKFLKKNHKIIYSDSKRTILLYKTYNIFKYRIIDFKKFDFSNQKNVINNKIYDFEKYKKKKFFLLNDNYNTKKGKLALGQNLLTAFISYEGYNFEDSIIISEKICNSDLYSTLHYNEIIIDLKKKLLNKDILNKNLFYIRKNNYKKLDSNGLARIGFYYYSGEVIAAIVRPILLSYTSPEEKLANKIIDNKHNLKYKNIYKTLDKGINGILTKIKIIKKNKYITKDGFKTKCNNNLFVYNKILKNFIIFKKQIFLKKFGINIVFNKKFLLNKTEIINKKIFYNVIIANNRIKFIRNKLSNLIKKKHYFLGTNIYKRIKLIFLSKRNLAIGDKMSGRHGNKGVVSKILPECDMPFLSDGTCCDLILNPLGIPSRMNLGQLYELSFGFIIFIIIKKIELYILKKSYKIILFLKKIGFSKINKKNIFNLSYYKKNISIISTPFEGAKLKDLKKLSKFVLNKKTKNKYLVNKKNKTILFNGKTGLKFNDYVSVGYMYFMKLHHVAYDKIHSRSTGPYSSITQQPLKGKSRFGGQRFGEMEVWALEAYGAAYVLQELLTVKSDDISGRKTNYINMSTGKTKIKINIPESFNILIRELKALCLNLKIK
ncbi:DNA-directed RNA polymerase subunit beta [Candidatus Vidania fulgoroideorum]